MGQPGSHVRHAAGDQDAGTSPNRRTACVGRAPTTASRTGCRARRCGSTSSANQQNGVDVGPVVHGAGEDQERRAVRKPRIGRGQGRSGSMPRGRHRCRPRRPAARYVGSPPQSAASASLTSSVASAQPAIATSAAARCLASRRQIQPMGAGSLGPVDPPLLEVEIDQVHHPPRGVEGTGGDQRRHAGGIGEGEIESTVGPGLGPRPRVGRSAK